MILHNVARHNTFLFVYVVGLLVDFVPYHVVLHVVFMSSFVFDSEISYSKKKNRFLSACIVDILSPIIALGGKRE